MRGSIEPAPASDHPHSLPYNPALDGLRAIAIAAVVGTHFGVPLFAQGENGVDVFFVLSGFLITSVLLRAVPAQALSEFYWNRFARLFPALAVLCAVYAIVGDLVGSRQVGADIGASLTYVANWTRAYDLGVPLYLPHVWSLSLEEQFYIVFPPILLGVDRLVSRPRLAFGLLGLSFAIAALRLALEAGGVWTDRLYNWLDTHSDGLALGAALAAWRSLPSADRSGEGPGANRNRWATALARGDVVAALGLLVCFAAVPWPRAVVATNVLAAWLIFGASDASASTMRAILASAPLVWLGRISYGLYLWHYPVLQYLSYEALLPWWTTLIVGVPTSLALATLSYTFVESPILRRRRSVGLRIRQRLGRLTATLTVCGMLGGGAYFLGPLALRSLAHSTFAVASYSPHASVVGESFNVQPGGLPAVQVETTTRPPTTLTATWQGKALPTFLSARGLVIFVPRTFTDTVGSKTIDIEVSGQTIPIAVDIVAHR